MANENEIRKIEHLLENAVPKLRDIERYVLYAYLKSLKGGKKLK